MTPHKNHEMRKATSKAWQKANPERVREINRDYYNRHKAEIALRKKVQHQKHKERIARAFAKYKQENPERIKAKDMANDHLQIKDACEFVMDDRTICGSKEHLDKHHPDYGKPFFVITLCRKHHQQVHKMLKEEKIDE